MGNLACKHFYNTAQRLYWKALRHLPNLYKLTNIFPENNGKTFVASIAISIKYASMKFNLLLKRV